MLQIYHSNRMECLVEELVQQLQSPLNNPMQPETVVVQNPGMAHWLSQQVADSSGIAANIEFPLPASFAWRVYKYWIPDIPDQTGFDKESLMWQIMGLLPQNIVSPVFTPLARYLQNDRNSILAHQLSHRVADLFDQYLVYRPDMLLTWERGQVVGDSLDEQWQASLWRDIVAGMAGAHRAAFFERFRNLQIHGQPPIAELPERLSIFGLTALAPVYLHALEALAAHTQVHLYLLNPCEEYWADIQDDKGLARRRGRWRQSAKKDVSTLLDVGNPLLASMGQVVQVFVDQLLELDATDIELFVPPEQNNLLSWVQQDILNLQDRRTVDQAELNTVEQQDLSIQIHACHSPMREVQVLHDQLRQQFDSMPQLQARDVVVMAPDIRIYAPYVEAVFGAASGDRHIPWSLADLGLQEEAPSLVALFELLNLPGFRFQASKIISLLETPAIAAHFDVDAEGLEQIRRWVAETAIRWGVDADMRAALGLPGEVANTWDIGLERMFMGYALPVDAGLQKNVLPYPDIEGSDAVYLGKLAALVECLQQWQSRLSTPVVPTSWVRRINQLLADFFTPLDEEESLLQSVRHAMDSMLDHCVVNGFDVPISVDIVSAELKQALDTVNTGSRFLQGGVTFCNMVPMRSIPFSVVCLLGMNDTDYPRSEQPLSFDLMASSPNPGDRSRRMDDRYLFMESLLSARDVFYLSYTARSVKDNSIKVPSVMLSELQDYLIASFKPAQKEDLLGQLLTNHPLQPFSHRYFDASDPRLISYDEGWLAAADTQLSTEVQPFADTQMPEAEVILQVQLEDLIQFVLNPAAWFLLQGVGVKHGREERVLEDEEAFALDSLTAYQLSDQVLDGMRQGKVARDYLALAVADGELPHGHVGEIAFAEQTDSLEEMVDRIGKYGGIDPGVLEVDLRIGDFHLTGWLDQMSSKGLLSYRPSRLKPKDRLRLWVKHLVLCAVREAGEVESVHVASDKTQIFKRVSDPAARLASLLQAWRHGQQVPLPFFPAASLEYIATGDLEKARKRWLNDYDCGMKNWFVQVAFRGCTPLEAPEFKHWADLLVAPLVEAGSVVP